MPNVILKPEVRGESGGACAFTRVVGAFHMHMAAMADSSSKRDDLRPLIFVLADLK
jgi:hypothetical protein